MSEFDTIDSSPIWVSISAGHIARSSNVGILIVGL